MALNEVIGAYAIVVIDKEEPNKLVAARKGSPMVVGLGDGEYFIASDASPIVEFTKNVIYLDDQEYVVIEKGHEVKVKNLDNVEVTPFIQELKLDLEEIEKGHFDHFMLKEIYEQSRVFQDAIRGRMSSA